MNKLRIIVAVITLIVLFLPVSSDAEQVQCYIICQPNDCVNVRISPSKNGVKLGRLETGYVVWTDGKKKNGFLHCENENLEQGDCWIHSGYIVYEEPVWMDGREGTVISRKRLAARKYIGGKVRKWLDTGDTVKVWWWTSEWCVTNQGFIQTTYLELDGE